MDGFRPVRVPVLRGFDIPSAPCSSSLLPLLGTRVPGPATDVRVRMCYVCIPVRGTVTVAVIPSSLGPPVSLFRSVLAARHSVHFAGLARAGWLSWGGYSLALAISVRCRRGVGIVVFTLKIEYGLVQCDNQGFVEVKDYRGRGSLSVRLSSGRSPWFGSLSPRGGVLLGFCYNTYGLEDLEL